jgi:uncharacterized protein DUF4384
LKQNPRRNRGETTMKKAVKLACIALSIATMAWPQENSTPPKGAKALFYDSTSDATVHAEKGGVAQRTSATKTKPNTGLKYWVELVQPNGQVLRVSSSQVFHSGEHIRLHFESNVDGNIVMVQMNPNGTSQVLYPDPHVNSGDSHVKAGTDRTVPGGDGWFTFDNTPGIERVMVFLNADSPTPATPRTANRSGSTAEDGDAIVGRALSNSSKGKIDAGTTAQLVARVDQERGGKSLVLEADDKTREPAEYVVKTPEPKSGSPAIGTVLATMIELKHQ